MRSFWENPFFTIPVLVFFAVGLWFTLRIPYGYELVYFNTWRAEPLNTFFKICTTLGEAPVYYVGTVAALFVRYRYALLIALCGLFILPISYFAKDKIGIDRPITYFEKEGFSDALVLVPNEELNTGQTSFPSGHTTSAFAFYALITMMARRRYGFIGVITAYTAILVGVSRIFLVQHFLVDILGGAALGLCIAWVFYHLNKKGWWQRLKILDGKIG